MTKLKRIGTVVAVTAMSIFVTGVVAYAQTPPPDPTGGAGGTIVSDVKDWVTNYGVAILIGLLTLGIVIKLLMRFVKRAARSV